MEVPHSPYSIRQESKLNKIRQKYIELTLSSLTSSFKSLLGNSAKLHLQIYIPALALEK